MIQKHIEFNKETMNFDEAKARLKDKVKKFIFNNHELKEKITYKDLRDFGKHHINKYKFFCLEMMRDEEWDEEQIEKSKKTLDSNISKLGECIVLNRSTIMFKEHSKLKNNIKDVLKENGLLQRFKIAFDRKFSHVKETTYDSFYRFGKDYINNCRDLAFFANNKAGSSHARFIDDLLEDVNNLQLSHKKFIDNYIVTNYPDTQILPKDEQNVI